LGLSAPVVSRRPGFTGVFTQSSQRSRENQDSESLGTAARRPPSCSTSNPADRKHPQSSRACDRRGYSRYMPRERAVPTTIDRGINHSSIWVALQSIRKATDEECTAAQKETGGEPLGTAAVGRRHVARVTPPIASTRSPHVLAIDGVARATCRANARSQRRSEPRSAMLCSSADSA